MLLLMRKEKTKEKGENKKQKKERLVGYLPEFPPGPFSSSVPSKV